MHHFSKDSKMKFAEIVTLSKKPIPDADFSVLLSREQLEAKEHFHTRHNTFYVKVTDPTINQYFIMGLINSAYFHQRYSDTLHQFQGNTRNTFLNLPIRSPNLTNKDEKLLRDRIVYGTKELLKIQQEMDLAEELFLRHLNTFQPRPGKGSLKEYILDKGYGTLLEINLEDISISKIQELSFEEEITQGAAGDDLHFGQTHILKLSYLPKGERAECPLLRWRVEDENLKLFLLFSVNHELSNLQGKTGFREKVRSTKNYLRKFLSLSGTGKSQPDYQGRLLTKNKSFC